MEGWRWAFGLDAGQELPFFLLLFKLNTIREMDLHSGPIAVTVWLDPLHFVITNPTGSARCSHSSLYLIIILLLWAPLLRFSNDTKILLHTMQRSGRFGA